MSIADYVIVAVVILAAIGALWYARRHPSCGCQGGCAACQKSCASRQEPAAGPNEKE